jgi:hypothetical protein
MKTYLIGYDLNKSGQNYTDLIEKIKTIGNWWHHLDSTWIVKSNSSAEQIRDFLRPYIDQNDELLVVRLNVESAWYGFNGEGATWLRNYLFE